MATYNWDQVQKAINDNGLFFSDADMALAQKNPDAHRDLRVRVTGYSGVFVDICERLQNDIIKRFE